MLWRWLLKEAQVCIKWWALELAVVCFLVLHSFLNVKTDGTYSNYCTFNMLSLKKQYQNPMLFPYEVIILKY
jgi:hypothetical protein